MPADVSLVLYRVAQEALRNVVRHAGVRTARLALARGRGEARLAVVEAGAGFEPGATRGLGLVSMEERVRLLGGRLRVASAPGKGTEIEAVVPLSQRDGPTPSPGRAA